MGNPMFKINGLYELKLGAESTWDKVVQNLRLNIVL